VEHIRDIFTTQYSQKWDFFKKIEKINFWSFLPISATFYEVKITLWKKLVEEGAIGPCHLHFWTSIGEERGDFCSVRRNCSTSFVGQGLRKKVGNWAFAKSINGRFLSSRMSLLSENFPNLILQLFMQILGTFLCVWRDTFIGTLSTATLHFCVTVAKSHLFEYVFTCFVQRKA
jgi:hypothetical protein